MHGPLNVKYFKVLHDDHLGTKFIASFGQGMPLFRDTYAGKKIYSEK